jgi:ankyrin repeat protein
MLCRVSVEVNAKDAYGSTPLARAAEYGNEAFAALHLKQADIYVNRKDSDGRTPLSVAAKNGHKAIVRLLLGRQNIDMFFPRRHWPDRLLFGYGRGALGGDAAPG